MSDKETRKHVMIPDNDLLVEANVRLPGNYQTEALCDDIAARGMTEHITVWQRAKGQYVVLRGHRRLAAAQMLKARDLDVYKERFPDGLPCEVISGIDANKALEYKVDHGNEVSLTNPHELQMCASMLFNAGKTEADVAVQLSGLMDRIYPMKAKAKAEITALRKVAAEAKTEKDKIIADNDVRKYVLNYRRGVVQGLHNAHRCPDIVMDALYFKATGEAPVSYTGKRALIKLTGTNVTTLFKAHKLDLEELDDDKGVPRYSKKLPGPKFWEAWTKIEEQHSAEDKRRADGNAKPKAKSAAIMTEESQTKWTSVGFRSLSLYHAGDNSHAEKLAKLDEIAYFAELVEGGNPEAWADMVATAKGIEKLKIEATQEATG